MSRFYADIHGQAKTVASRQGNSKSGIGGHIRGRNIGIRVESRPMIQDGYECDCFDIYVTGGSNEDKQTERIATVCLPDKIGERVVWVRTSRATNEEMSYTLANYRG